MPVNDWNEPGADQSHVVIERQPADGDIVRLNIDAADDRLNICEQIGVRENHAFGIAGGSGSVLQESDIFAAGAMREMFHRPPFAGRRCSCVG